MVWCPSVSLSVCPIYGLLWAWQAGDMDRLLHGRCPAAVASQQRGVLQQMSRSQLT